MQVSEYGRAVSDAQLKFVRKTVFFWRVSCWSLELERRRCGMKTIRIRIRSLSILSVGEVLKNWRNSLSFSHKLNDFFCVLIISHFSHHTQKDGRTVKSDENYIENEQKKSFSSLRRKIPSIIVVWGGLKVLFCLLSYPPPTAAMLSASWKERYPEQAEKISSVKRKLFSFFCSCFRRLHQDPELS